MSDVRLFDTKDGGEITVTNGRFKVDEGLETAAYLSLFGGNDDDPGIDPDDLRQWWGDLSETDPSRKYRSETQNLLRSLPLTPFSLKRIEDAVARDLSWFTDDGFATSVTVLVTMPGVNRVLITVNIEVDGSVIPLEFEATTE